jgi:hypothetical protein
MDLRSVAPRFPAAEEIPDDIDVGWLIAEFSGNAEAIATVVVVEWIIKDAPLRSRLYASCRKKM